MPLRGRGAILMVLISGCVTRTVKQREPVAIGAGGKPGDAEAVVRLALALDAKGDRKADTLYTPDAIVIRNARARLAPRAMPGSRATTRRAV